MNNSYIIFLITIITISSGCKKKSAVKIDNLFKNEWKHFIDANHSEILIIPNSAKGTIEQHENGQLISDTQPRKWLIKNNRLYFGWISFKGAQYSIESYPTVALNTLINDFDTINVGDSYIILDGNYYLALE